MKKRFLILLAALLLLISSFTACNTFNFNFIFGDDAEDDTEDEQTEDNGGGSDTSVPIIQNQAPIMNADGIKFTNYGEYYSVTGYQAPNGASNVDLTIPATYEGLPVKSIGTRAFAPSAIETNKVIRSITVSEGIVSIEASAFADCETMTSITIPSSVTSIDRNAFARCKKLTEVTIPASVTTIGDSIFENCILLENIAVAPENPNYCSIDGDLYSKDGTVLIRYAIGKSGGSFTPAETVTTLASGSLQAATFTEVNIPATLVRIEPTAFKDCTALTSVKVAVTKNWRYSDYEDAVTSAAINENNVMKKPGEFARMLVDKNGYLRRYVYRVV